MLRSIEVDHTMREPIYYKDTSFPLDIWTDVYSQFVNATMNCHWHNAFEFGVMLSGELDYTISGVPMKLQKGEGVFVNANTMHMATQGKGCSDAVMFTMVFPPALFTGGAEGTVHEKYFLPVMRQSMPGCKLDGSPLGRRIVQKLEAAYALPADAPGYELQCLALLSQVWLDTLEYLSLRDNKAATRPKYENQAKAILSYIRAHFGEDIRIDDLARHANISRSECFRCFRHFTGKKPVAYINEYRLAHAANMLRETEDAVADIATACGFSSSSYFGKLFREKYAASPLQYRQGFLQGFTGL